MDRERLRERENERRIEEDRRRRAERERGPRYDDVSYLSSLCNKILIYAFLHSVVTIGMTAGDGKNRPGNTEFIDT
jgi:hypothetical protein